MISYFVPVVCSRCKWLFEGNGVVKSGKWSCRAFPKGIIDDMYYTDNKHKKPFSSQKNNLVFEKASKLKKTLN